MRKLGGSAGCRAQTTNPGGLDRNADGFCGVARRGPFESVVIREGGVFAIAA